MKRFILLLCLIAQVAFGQNRLSTPDDIVTYGDYVKPGIDLIFDTPTKKFADNINQLRYVTISKSFPGLKEGGTIWIDGEKIGPLCEFRLLNGTETTPWHVSSVTIRPIPGTQVKGIYTANSYGGFLFLVQGVKNLVMDGTSEKYKGLYELKKGDFLTGRFGFRGTSNGYFSGYHVYSISVLGGGSFEFTNFEGEHGFSVLRFQGGSYDNQVKLKVRNAYAHDTESEGFYLRATHAPPLSKGTDDIADVIIARSGSEGLQLQHLIGNSHIRAITIFSPDCGYLNQFQPGQDTGIQLNPDEGNTVIEGIVVDSWGSHGLNLFGSEYQSTTKNTTIRNILFANGRGEAVYIHPSCKWGMNWVLDNLFVYNLTGDYYINNKTPKPSWIISRNNGTDQFTITNNIYKDLPAIEYVNSGFYESADKIKFYSRYYAKYITGVENLPVTYKPGEIVVDRETLKSPVFTKCIRENMASEIRPRYDTTNYIVLSWDEKGVRNDQPSWDAGSVQRPYPPDDLRVSFNNFYALKGIGFIEQKPSYESLLTRINDLETLGTAKDSIIRANEDLYNELSQLFRSQQQMNQQLREKITGMLEDIEAIKEKYTQP